MNVEWIRDLCLSFPHTTEHIQWGDNLVFKVAGKIHAIVVLHPASIWLSFKVAPEQFAELIERSGIIPAPYLARAKWVALETKDALPSGELSRLLRDSYDIVVAKLPARTRETLHSGSPSTRSRSHKKRKSKRRSPRLHRKTKKPSR